MSSTERIGFVSSPDKSTLRSLHIEVGDVLKNKGRFIKPTKPRLEGN